MEMSLPQPERILERLKMQHSPPWPERLHNGASAAPVSAAKVTAEAGKEAEPEGGPFPGAIKLLSCLLKLEDHSSEPTIEQTEALEASKAAEAEAKTEAEAVADTE